MNLEIRQLTFGWRETPLLEQVDVCLDGGTMVLLQGENGSGKTTLLKLIAGMIPHFSRGLLHTGDILLNGTSVGVHPPREFFPLIAFVPSRNIDFYLLNVTLAEELLLIEAVLPGAGAEVRTRMARFRGFFPKIDTLFTPPLAALPIADLLLCLASIYFVQGARIWLLDEPFGYLTPRECDVWERFFTFLRDQESIIIASSHISFGSDLPVWRLHGGRLEHD